MKILVIGLGSMGRRRIRLIKGLDTTHEIIGVDTNLLRCQQTEEQFAICTKTDLEEALKEKIDCVFISTSPMSHNNLVDRCLSGDCHVFTELNLVSDGYKKNIELSVDKRKVLFLSSTLLYRKEVEFIKENVTASTGNLIYSYHVGQYLPDWHPWENYQDFFVKDKCTNGCREIFAIELPWLTDVFGSISTIEVRKSKSSKLDINYNDNYQMLIEHESGARGVLLVDVISRKPIRNFEVFSEDLYLTWNGQVDGLFLYDFEHKMDRNVKLYEEIDKISEYSSHIIEDAYVKEIENFFGVINHQEHPRYSFEKDEKILEVIDLIEKD